MDERKAQRLAKKYAYAASPNKQRGGPRGRRGMMGGKPKNAKDTIKRLFYYMGRDKWKLTIVILCVVLN